MPSHPGCIAHNCLQGGFYHYQRTAVIIELSVIVTLIVILIASSAYFQITAMKTISILLFLAALATASAQLLDDCFAHGKHTLKSTLNWQHVLLLNWAQG